jgi:HAE1 family hydrophobic/amphiphilic exporter-1
MRAGFCRSPSSSACRSRGAANDLYTQIGLVLLIALGSKNAILVVEYARQRRAEGMEIVTAAVEGARLRLRPILMTSFAFILGVFPLVMPPAQAPEHAAPLGFRSSAA